MSEALLHRGLNALRVSGCFLMGPVTIGMLYAFMSTDYLGSARIYCKNLAWSEPFLIDDCQVSTAQDKICESNLLDMQRRHDVPPTITSMIERWPYVSCFVLGLGATNLFTCLIMVSYFCNRPHLTLYVYACIISLWGVFGTSASDLSSYLDHVHSVFTCLLLFFCTWAVASMSMDESYVFMRGCVRPTGLYKWGVVGQVLVLVLAGVGMFSSAVALYILGNQNSVDAYYKALRCLSIFEQIFLLGFVVCMWNRIRAALCNIFAPQNQI
jgi:hypothetical protein